MSNLYIGTEKPEEIYIGTQKCKAVYLGTNKVWKQGRLPAEYTECEWIGSSGTQYIDTGIVLAYGDVVECRYTITTKGQYKSVWGAYDGDKKAYFGMNTSTNYYLRLAVGNSAKVSAKKADTNEHTAVATFTVGASTLSIDGTNILTHTAISELPSYSCFLFADSDAGTLDGASSTRLATFKVRRGGVLIGDFVPCYTTSEIGMFDNISRAFKTNLGTGTFTKGADVI